MGNTLSKEQIKTVQEYGQVFKEWLETSEGREEINAGIPVISNETKELVAFVELRWEKDDYNRKTL